MSRTAKRIILAVLILLGLLVIISLVLPGVVGWQVQKGMEGALGGKGLRTADGLQVRLQAFERGWFQSHARIALRLPGVPLPLTMDQDIIHGPLYFGELGHGRSPLILIASKADLLAGSDALASGYSVLGPSMVLSSEWYLEDGILQTSGIPAWIRLNYQVLKGDTDLQVNIPVLRVQQGRENLRLEDLRLKGQARIRPGQLVLGELRFSLQDLAMQGNTGNLALQDLRMLLVAGASSDRVKLDLDLSLSHMEEALESYGPVRIVLAIDKLPPEKMGALFTVQQVLARAFSGNIRPAQRQQLLEQKVLPALYPILAEAEVQLDELLMHSGGGWIEGKMQLRFNSQEPMSTPLDLAVAADLKGELRISRHWLLAAMESQLRQQLDMLASGGARPLQRDDRDEEARLQAERLVENLVRQSYLEASEGVYQSRIRMNDARLFMNDKEVDILSLIQ